MTTVQLCFYYRQHVVTVHGMRHMRNFKMQWYGDSANIPGKKDRYMDKSHVWNQKIKVMASFLIYEIVSNSCVLSLNKLNSFCFIYFLLIFDLFLNITGNGTYFRTLRRRGIRRYRRAAYRPSSTRSAFGCFLVLTLVNC